VAEVVDRYLDQAPRWLRLIEHDIATGEGEGVAAATALAGSSRALGAEAVADLAERLGDALRREDPGAAEGFAATGDALYELTEGLRERRTAGWPDG
jgi:HPt (histidine-containing phosphotransfer) domain-containing protein